MMKCKAWILATVLLLAAVTALSVITWRLSSEGDRTEALLQGVLDRLATDPSWGKVLVDEVWAMLASRAPLTLLDVRTPAEYERGYIPGALNLPLEQLVSGADRLTQDRERLIIVYCHHSWRATIAMVVLRLMGFSNAKGLEGGFAAWVQAGLPVEAE